MVYCVFLAKPKLSHTPVIEYKGVWETDKSYFLKYFLFKNILK
jgi:hypothetical protein